MKRKIIRVDETKCNGCGLCIPHCQEGALQLIDGKARVISELFFDGLDACIGDCPQGAIRIVERESEPYDEAEVMGKMVHQGDKVVRAHLKYLRAHGEFRLLAIATEYLREQGLPVPAPETPGKTSAACPGTVARKIAASMKSRMGWDKEPPAGRHWPIQLDFVDPDAQCFDRAELLISGDCVAYMHEEFRRDLQGEKILIVFCPKLNPNCAEYVEKLAEIFLKHEIDSITAAAMAAACCGGMVALIREALQKAGKQIEIIVKIIGLDGEIQSS